MIGSYHMGTKFNEAEIKKDLEETLSRLKLDAQLTNITQDDLLKIYSGSSETKLKNCDRYDLFHQFLYSEEAVCFNLIDLCFGFGGIYLGKRKYGFRLEDKISIKPSGVELNLNESSRDKYEFVLSQKEISVHELLRLTGEIINETMLFSPENSSGPELEAGNLVMEIAKDSYKPTGKETLRGMCSQAGSLIRTLLHSYSMPNNLKYMRVKTQIHPVSHDTTLVFDYVTGNWAVINSKSPRIEVNLASKEDLKRLGQSYMFVNT